MRPFMALNGRPGSDQICPLLEVDGRAIGPP
jgi:hypothetical protein